MGQKGDRLAQHEQRAFKYELMRRRHLEGKRELDRLNRTKKSFWRCPFCMNGQVVRTPAKLVY